MASTTFDSENYRAAFAPVQVARHEWLKATERVARLQIAIAEDVLKHGFASLNAMFDTSAPGDYLRRQGELTADLYRKTSDHVQTFMNETSRGFEKSGESMADAAHEFGEAAKRAGKEAQQVVEKASQRGREAAKQTSGQH